MTTIYFRELEPGKQTPEKLEQDDLEYFYPEPLFDKIKEGETIMYVVNKFDGTSSRKQLYVKEVYINKDGIPTIEGDFSEENRWN